MQIYERDTFFELTLLGRAGLTMLSILLALVVVYIAFILYKNGPRHSLGIGLGSRLIIAATLLWLFLWLSPQAYYLYYQTIFDGLPWQIVIMTPPSIRDLGDILFFQGRNSLAEHSKAVLGWILILGALVATRMRHTG
jgi:hypothetical protein